MQNLIIYLICFLFFFFSRVWFQRRQNFFNFLICLEGVILCVWILFLFLAASFDVFMFNVILYLLFTLGCCDGCIALQALYLQYRLFYQLGEYEALRA